MARFSGALTFHPMAFPPLPEGIRYGLAVLLATFALGAPGAALQARTTAGQDELAEVPGDSDDGLADEIQRQLDAVDPLEVGWGSEALNSRCGNE